MKSELGISTKPASRIISNTWEVAIKVQRRAGWWSPSPRCVRSSGQ